MSQNKKTRIEKIKSSLRQKEHPVIEMKAVEKPREILIVDEKYIRADLWKTVYFSFFFLGIILALNWYNTFVNPNFIYKIVEFFPKM